MSPAPIPIRPAAPALAPTPAEDALQAAFARAEAVFVQEIAALRAAAPLDLDDFTFRKSQIYLDVIRLGRDPAVGRLGPEAAARAANLRQLIADDLALLALHLEAVRRISDIIADAVRQDSSDGTYSFGPRGAAS